MLCVRSLWKKRNNLSYRLTRIYAFLFACAMLLLSLTVYFVSWHFLLSRKGNELESSAANVLEVFYEEIAEGHEPNDPQVLWELNPNEDMALILLSPERQPITQAIRFDVDYSEIPECKGNVVLYSQDDEMSLMAWEKEMLLDGASIGTLTVLLRVDSELEFLDMLAGLLIILNVIGLLTAIAVGWYTSKRMLTPIASIIRKANAIDEGALHMRLEAPEADDELKLLSETLNDMLERVEAAFVRQGQFTQDASHELRTPMAVLGGNADLLARWGKNDPVVRDKCIAAIQKQVEYMSHLVENLLFLSRGDSGVQAIQREEFSLNEMLTDILEERRIVDTEHIYLIDANVENVFADENLIRQLLLILLDNAAKYTPEGKAILTTAKKNGNCLELAVKDEGCGVPPEQLADIFDRFYRVDKARARETGGTGLGLAIAKTIVQMHGGRIWAENAEGGGLNVCVEVALDNG